MTALVSALRFWAGTAVAHALGRALLHFLWEGAAIAALLAALLLFSRSARVRYALALAAMLALPVAFAVTWAISMRSVLPLGPAPHFAAPYRMAPPGVDFPIAPASADRFSWLVPLWMAGVLLCYLRSAVGWAGALRLRRRGVCAAPEFWQGRVHALAARIRISRPVLLLESCIAEIPVTLGWFRPVILLPVGLLAGLPAEQVEAILMHELAHIRRADFAVNLLLSFVEGLLFYHPAVWWISRVVRTEREHCCDDAVVAGRFDARTYAAALARLEHNRAIAREALLAANGGNLMRRIRRLLDSPEQPRSAAAPAAIIVLLLLGAAAALAWAPSPKPQQQDTAAPAERQPVTPARKPIAEKQKQRRESALAQSDGSAYRKWLNEDVAYIITDEERTAFKRAQTNDEREKFIEDFWLRRDPTPGTVENEMKEEHYRRIAFANERFASAIPGWKTDRGRIYIVYGPPDEIEDHPNGTADVPVPFQQWRYRFIANIGKNVIVQFTDQNRDGEYRMTLDPSAPDRAALAGPRPPAMARPTVKVGANGTATFSVPFELAAQAYTGSYTIARQSDGVVVMQGQFDPRFGGQTVKLAPGSYKLRVTLKNPQGEQADSSADFTVR
jgi:GWxTD domain-containing protein